MASEETEGLVRLCLETAAQSRDSIQRWRKQKRTLELLPSHLSEALFHLLLRRRLLFPSLLEVFRHSVEEIDLRVQNSVDAEWMAYLGAFGCLRSLVLAECSKINNDALWPLIGMSTLKELNLSRCSKINDVGVKYLLQIPTLEKLSISETSVTSDGVKLLSSLSNLSLLDLGGLLVTDEALSSLQVLQKLQHLDIWGSKVTNGGAAVLRKFPRLSFLNLAWTNVTKLLDVPSLACLNMSNCTIDSLLATNGPNRTPLDKLVLSGATLLVSESAAFFYIYTNVLSFLDISNSNIRSFWFLSSMKALKYLDLSGTMFGDDSVEQIATIGVTLKSLNLSKTRISSAGMEILAGRVPNLEMIYLSDTPIDDSALFYISTMPSLKDINLSNTKVKGVTRQTDDENDFAYSLAALQSLRWLERLDLDGNQISDSALYPVSGLQELNYLSLKSGSLSDGCLEYLSSPPKLKHLCIRDAVLSNGGIQFFKPPAMLKMLDLMGCWLLSVDAILLFSENHPQIEVKHELSPLVSEKLSAKQSTLNTSTMKNSPSKQKQKQKMEKMPMLPSSSMKSTFLDQRLKYNREELLAMQYSSLSLASQGAYCFVDELGLKTKTGNELRLCIKGISLIKPNDFRRLKSFMWFEYVSLQNNIQGTQTATRIAWNGSATAEP
ncbi:Leucine-rich repeat, partial [Dillenia turbinata]